MRGYDTVEQRGGIRCSLLPQDVCHAGLGLDGEAAVNHYFCRVSLSFIKAQGTSLEQSRVAALVGASAQH